ncbi:MAG TPA: pyridoxal 5'-phosphate synthase glutaminase subunit PdxT [Candidatus Dormibacteraeota bacterium]|nr:pyridoxal 5'-phosphate synthase glutaminase subunit PdxT [Candidatus Dormibacteraeota bacterium]
MTNPLVGVLALQGDVREHRQAFERCGVLTREVRLPAELEQIDALALPGGESTTMSRLLRVFGLDEPLRHRLQEGLPTFATCAGLILLSARILDGRPDQLALGALDVDVRRNGYGRQVDSFETDLRIAALGETPFTAVFIRAPLIERTGRSVEVLASVDGNPVAIAQGPHLALGFHPEMTHDDRLHRLFLQRLSDPVASAA